MSSKWEDERWCVVHWCWGHWHQAKPNPTNQPTMGLAWPTLENRASASNKCKLGLVYIIYIYIYTINCQCVHSLFDTLCLLEQKTDEFNKTMKLTCPLSVHPQSKQIEFETLVAASGERSYRTKGQHSVLHPNNLSLSLSLSLSLFCKWLLVTNVRL
jgi:hypothetical protein